MATIAQILQQIRYAVFGKEVRESIAQGIEKCYDNYNTFGDRVDAETQRAMAEEQRLEELFTTPTQEAVDEWLSGHPEATTTVEDHSITKVKLNQELTDGMVETSYYDDLIFETERINSTDCYWVTIPVLDSNGNLIKPYVGYDANSSPLEYAQEHGTTLTTNNGIMIKLTNGQWKTANMIGRGNVLYSQDITSQDELISQGIGYLSISEDRQTYKEWPITTPLSTLQADSSVWNCFTYYCKILNNSELVDISDLVTNEGGPIDVADPQMGIGIKADKTIIIFCCDGRNDYNVGITTSYMAELLRDKGCVNAWMMDGGGSCNLTLRGAKQNRNIDSNGTVDRAIHCTFNVERSSKLLSISDIFSQIGLEKQRLIQQLVPYINSERNRFYKVYTQVDLDNINRTSIGYHIRPVHKPSGTSNYAFVATFVAEGLDGDDVRWQVYYNYVDNATSSNKMYMRQCLNNVWNDWTLFTASTPGYVDMSIKGVELTGTEGTYHYKEIAIPTTGVPSNAKFVGLTMTGVVYTDLEVVIANTNIMISSANRTSVPTPSNGRDVGVRLHYIVY